MGRKGRKTTFDINELAINAMTDTRGLTYPFIGPTRTQAKEIVWEDHIQAILNICDKYGILYKRNNSELSVRFYSKEQQYGKITVDGSDNIESLRGKSDWGGVVCDEFASWKNKRYAWEEVIEPNLSVHNAWAVLSGTPKGYEYFHRLMKLGDHKNKIEGEAFDEEGRIVAPDNDFVSFRFTSYDNPFLDHEWVNRKKTRLSTVSFNQEYLARFEKFTGVIYKEFEREIHVIPPFEIPEQWPIYSGMDFGAVHPTVHLWIAVGNSDTVYITKEYVNSSQTSKFNASVIKAMDSGRIPVIRWRDPSAEQEGLDYAAEDVITSPAPKIFNPNKTWVLSGIDKVQELLKPHPQTKRPRVYVFSTCRNTIKGFETYRWLETKRGDKIKNEPLKEGDDEMDALRYFVEGFTAGQMQDSPEDVAIETNKFTGY